LCCISGLAVSHSERCSSWVPLRICTALHCTSTASVGGSGLLPRRFFFCRPDPAYWDHAIAAGGCAQAPEIGVEGVLRGGREAPDSPTLRARRRSFACRPSARPTSHV
jgi:hypothetical protein